MIELLVLTIGMSLTFIIALTIFVKNYQSSTNKYFFALAVSLIGWSLFTFLSTNTSDDASTLLLIRLVMVFVVAQTTSFLVLALIFPSPRITKKQSLFLKYFLIYSVITALSAGTNLLFPKFEEGAPVPGPGMILFLPHAVFSVVGGIYILCSRYKKASGYTRKQLLYFIMGTLILFTLVPIGNFIVPVLFKTNLFVTLSPLYSVIFASFIAYAILSKGLFDIRAIVARSVAYLLLILSLSLLYGLLIISISTLFLQDEVISFKTIALFAISALVIGYSLQPLKVFFDKASNRIFFRDAYSSQDVLNTLSNMLAKNVELNIISKQSLNIISDAVRPLGSKLLVLNNDKQYLTESYGEHFETENIINSLNDLREQITVVGDSENSKQNRILKNHDIEIVVRLQNQETVIGYLLLKAKKSGNIYSNQDINLLNISANEVAIAIQNALHFDEIQKFNVTLQRKIDVATAQLKHNNEKLKALDEAKDEFISMASHQLRTPLTSIKGYVSMVMDEDAGKITKEQRELLTSAFNSSQRMVYLIADLLNVSRLHTGKFVIEPSEVNLADVIESEITQLHETALGHQIKLEYKKPKKVPTILLDETKTRQVIMNFIDNAIYYTPKGGTVKMALKSDRKKIEFTVTDNGIGVPKSEQKNLFTKFYRAGNARKARPDGTGLGLFMAKKVIVAQEGALIFHSKEGKGSTFGFTFPLDKVAVKPKKSK